MSSRDYLFGLEFHGIKLGLENIQRLLGAAGNPHLAYPVVHVAGTNGKGSVVAMVASMLEAAGYRVGRFTSPHLLELNERFLVNREPVGDEVLDASIGRFRRAAEALAVPPTFFEVCTGVAFDLFAREKVDVAVVEVGLGGRLDSTNVVEPEACAITNIELEHTQYLGETLEEIAYEKAGIIKAGRPVVAGETKAGPRGVIEKRARDLGSLVYQLGRDFDYALEGPRSARQLLYTSAGRPWEPMPMALAGRCQASNAAVAVALAERLGERFPRLDEGAIARGLAGAKWPCRLERVLEKPPVIVDVAHNVAGARTVAEELPPSVVILAVSSDKNAAGMIEALEPVTEKLILSAFQGARALPVEALARAAGGRADYVTPCLSDALELGFSLASDDVPLVVLGSVFTAGEARRILIRDYGAAPLAF